MVIKHFMGPEIGFEPSRVVGEFKFSSVYITVLLFSTDYLFLDDFTTLSLFTS